MSLSPWDLSGNISFDFSLYRPRRPSYVFATQVARRRNESYRHATKSDSSGAGDPGIEEDFIEGIVKKKRKDSYRQATEDDEINIEMGPLDATDSNHIGPIPELPNEDACSTVSYHVPVHRQVPEKKKKKRVRDAESPTRQRHRHHSGDNDVFTDSRTRGVMLKHSRWRYRKNLIVLSVSFILIFTAFRSIQNLQSSLNTEGRLGVIAMACVHGTMFLTCLFAPVLINKLTSKWTIVLGLLFYLFWIVANFYPHFYTLIPTSIGVGFGQSLAWGAQITYIQKLAIDYAHLSRELTHQELSKFNGIFLACFQTTHIWGNVISSVMLTQLSKSPSNSPQTNSHGVNNNYDDYGDGDFPDVNVNGNPPMGGMDYNDTGYGIVGGPGNPSYPSYPGMPMGMSPADGMPNGMEGMPNGLTLENGGAMGGYPQGDNFADAAGEPILCGIYDQCMDRVPYADSISKTAVTSASDAVLKLMGSYLVFAFTGFVLILLFLEKIGAKSDPEKPCLQMVWHNVQQLFKHKTYRLLIPLLLFNGFEQGFVYADYNKSYISCAIGVEYVGYNMITLGVANSIFSILVGLVSRHIPREAIVGVGSILHIGLIVYLLVCIPSDNLFPVYFVLSALWGICDAIWQTQCNCLVNLSCPDDHDVAFQNFRMLQGLGACMAFALSAMVCVQVKLYIIISLLILSILSYALAEYRLRRELGGLADSVG